MLVFSDFQQETWDWTVIIIYNRVSSVDHVVCISRKGNLSLPSSVSSSWSISSVSGAVQRQSLPAWTGTARWRTGLSVTLSAQLSYSTELHYSTELPYSTLLGWSDQQSAAIRSSVHNSWFSTTTRRGRPKWTTLPWSSHPTVNIIIIVYHHMLYERDEREVILVSVLETGLPGIAVPPGATITSRSAVWIRINFWRMVGLYIFFGRLSVEGLRLWDWSYPVLQYLREWPTPTVIIFDMSTVVKPQQPPHAVYNDLFLHSGMLTVMRIHNYCMRMCSCVDVLIVTWSQRMDGSRPLKLSDPMHILTIIVCGVCYRQWQIGQGCHGPLFEFRKMGSSVNLLCWFVYHTVAPRAPKTSVHSWLQIHNQQMLVSWSQWPST